ncbi:MAG: SAM-dependent methyltransferase [Clostridia bacterium]|nr:SAM-dependent methyltransferase [Clostridia bacterium]
MIKLTNRLKTAASFVRADRVTADVGTDHGYLPAFLVMSGITKDAIAADIAEGPLDNARKTVEKYALQNNIRLILSDGLDNIPHNVDELIICGMGGNLIADVLAKAEWIKNENMHLVLQPMTHSQDVRQYLAKNGFYIDAEKTCCDDNKNYIVISAFYSGENAEKDGFYYLFGDKISPDSSTDKAYIKRQYSFLRSRYEGLLQGNNEAEAQKYKALLEKAEKAGFDL